MSEATLHGRVAILERRLARIEARLGLVVETPAGPDWLGDWETPPVAVAAPLPVPPVVEPAPLVPPSYAQPIAEAATAQADAVAMAPRRSLPIPPPLPRQVMSYQSVAPPVFHRRRRARRWSRRSG